MDVGVNGPQDMEIGGLATVHLIPASDQNAVSYDLPTVSSWFKGHWYVPVVVGVILLFCLAGVTVSAVRWRLRRQQRDLREEKNKRDVLGGLSRVASTLSMSHRDMAADDTPEDSPKKAAAPTGVGASGGYKRVKRVDAGQKSSARTPSVAAAAPLGSPEKTNDNPWGAPRTAPAPPHPAPAQQRLSSRSMDPTRSPRPAATTAVDVRDRPYPSQPQPWQPQPQRYAAQPPPASGGSAYYPSGLAYGTTYPAQGIVYDMHSSPAAAAGGGGYYPAQAPASGNDESLTHETSDQFTF